MEGAANEQDVAELPRGHHVIEFCGRFWAESHYGDRKWTAESTAGDMVEFTRGHPPIMDEERLVAGRDAANLAAFLCELQANEAAMDQFTRLLQS